MATKDPVTQKAEAKHREAEAQLDVLQAQAEARKAKEEMDEISGAGVKRAIKNFVWFDDAAQRRLDAQVEAAEAKLRVWKAHADVKHAERSMKRHDALATLEERIALARARDAERRHDEHSQKAAEALVEAVQQLDRAYDAAAKLYALPDEMN